MVPGRRGAGAAHPPADPVERRGDGPAGERPVPGHRRPHVHLCLRGHPLRGWLQPLLPGQGPPRRRRPGVLPGPRGARHLRPRVPRGPPHGGPARPLPSRDRSRRALVLPAPAADAGLLGVPDGLDGPRSAGRHLPGEVQPLSREPWDQGHDAAARLGLPRRRRDGRARVDLRHLPGRPRRPRQPHLRRQLQPPAAGRSRPRQRQDHPGAGGPVPGRRLERGQGGLGPRVGRPPRPGHGRRAGREDEHHGGRRVPEVLGLHGRVCPRALLRAGPAPSRAGGAPLRRRPAPPSPRRPRLPQGLRGLQGGDGVHGCPHRHPGQDGEGLDPRPRRRGTQHHPPGEEAARGRAARLPGPPGAADPRPAHRRGALLPPGPGLRRGPVHAGASGGARRPGAAAGGPGSRPAPARSPRGRGVQRWQHHRGLDHDGLRPPAAQPDPGPEAGPADRPDHPGRGPHLRHGSAVQGGRHLRRPRPALRPGGLGPGALLPRGPGTARCWRRGSTRRVRWPRCRRPARPMPRTASR